MDGQHRRLGLPHFAFYRAYLEGLDQSELASVADHYLATGRDPRRVQSTLRWLQDELAAAARRVGDKDAIRFLRLPKTLGDTAAPAALPTLDEYRTSHDPDGVYSETELLQLYQHHYPHPVATRRQQRDIRLRTRRLEALKRLEQAVVEAPASVHAVEAWFDPSIVRHLRHAGVTTLHELAGLINSHGYRWYTRVPRLGVKTAQRVVTWLRANGATLSSAVLDRAAKPLRQQSYAHLIASREAASSLVCFESLRVPEALSGAAGSNRARREHNQTNADDDLAALTLWLSCQKTDSPTWRSYRTQAERLLLWSIFEKGRSLSSLTPQDLREYCVFLQNPPAHWLGSAKVPRWSDEWRPFVGPLAPSSQRTAHNVLGAMFQWMMDVGYLGFNAWRAARLNISKSASPASSISGGLSVRSGHPSVYRRAGRMAPEPPRQTANDKQAARDTIALPQFEALQRYVEAHAGEAWAQRARFMLPFAYHTGLRVSELAAARLEHLNSEVSIVSTVSPPFHGTDASPILHMPKKTSRWTLNCAGANGKIRQVPIPPLVMERLFAYLMERGQPDDPSQWQSDITLIARMTRNGKHGLGAMEAPALALAYKKLFERFAEHLAKSDSDADLRLAERWKRASVKWLGSGRRTTTPARTEQLLTSITK